MKVALCLSGFIGNINKWIDGPEIDYHYGYEEYIKKNILQGYDVDVFIHSWSTTHKDGITKLYNPKDSLFEPNIDFKLRGVIEKKQLPTPYSYAVKSMWYSRKKSIELVEAYEKQNSMKYDFVLLTRFDIALFKKFKFEQYDSDKIYIAGPVLGKRLPNGHTIPHKINDMYFLANTKNMKKIVGLYETYEDIAVKENNNWPLESVSSHVVITNHFLNEGLFSITDTLFDRVWQSSTAWSGDVRFLRSDPNVKILK